MACTLTVHPQTVRKAVSEFIRVLAVHLSRSFTASVCTDPTGMCVYISIGGGATARARGVHIIVLAPKELDTNADVKK